MSNGVLQVTCNIYLCNCYNNMIQLSSITFSLVRGGGHNSLTEDIIH